MNPINRSEAETLLRSFVGGEVYLHSEATSYLFVRNYKVQLNEAHLAGEGPFRAALRFGASGWLRIEALTHAEYTADGRLLLAGYDDRGRMDVALHLGKEPFPE